MKTETTQTPPKPTPLEKLHAEKLACKARSRELEEKLNGHFTYIQQNSGELLISSFTSLLFPKRGQGAGDREAGTDLPALPHGGLGLSDYLSIGKSILPHLWSMAKPILVTWGIGKAQSILVHRLFGKKKMK